MDGEVGLATFVAEKDTTLPDSVEVFLYAGANEGSGLTKVLVVKELVQTLDHFAVRVEPDTVEHGKSAVITVIAQDANNNEVTIEGITPLTFTVDKPEYGSIEPAAGVMYSVARTGGVRYFANGTNPSTPQRIGITVAGAGKIGGANLVVKKLAQSLDHFAVSVSPDTIEHSATATITVQAKDRNNNDIELASGTKVNVVLRADEKYGNLTYAGRTGKAIDNIPYEDAKQGEVKFVADGENPIGLEPQKVDVGVTGEGKSGVGQVVVKCKVQPPHYRQGSGDWAGDIYDHTDATIADLGCALSSMAMAMTVLGDTVNPRELNEWMNNRTSEKGGYIGPSVNWRAISVHSGDKIAKTDPEDVDATFDLSTFDSFLDKCGVMIVKVFNFESVKNKSPQVQEKKRKEGNHWVLITGKKDANYSILDPGRGLTLLSDYGRIYRYLKVSKK